MLKKNITICFGFILLTLQIILLSACSFDSEDKEKKHPLLKTSTYSTELNGVSVHLSLHPLDGMEDILQADVMIHQADGSGPSFEVQNASLEESDGLLSFDWVDGFGNKGSAELKMPNATAETSTIIEAKDANDTEGEKLKKQQTVQLILNVEEVVNERNMMFIKEYVLTRTDDDHASKPSSEKGLPDTSN